MLTFPCTWFAAFTPELYRPSQHQGHLFLSQHPAVAWAGLWVAALCTWFPGIRGLHLTVLLEVPLLSPVGFPTLGPRTLLAWCLPLILSPYFCVHILRSFPEDDGRSLGLFISILSCNWWPGCLRLLLGKKFPLDIYFLAPSVAEKSDTMLVSAPFSLEVFKRLCLFPMLHKLHN